MPDWYDDLLRRLQSWQYIDHLYRVRWILVGFGIVVLVAIPWGLRAEERSLEAATRTALDEAGIEVDEVSFSGRSGVVVADLTPAEHRRAAATVNAVNGVRDVEFQIVDATATSTPSTTVPQTSTTVLDSQTHLVLTISADGLSIEGLLPSAGVVAQLGRVAERLYGDDVVNALEVDTELPATAWLDGAADALVAMPNVSTGTLTLSERGAVLVATVADDDVTRRLTTRLQSLLGADVALRSDVEVSDTAPPTFDLEIVGETSIAVSGVVPASLAAAIRDELDRETEEVVDDLTVGAHTHITYATSRIPSLLSAMTAAEDVTLRIAEGEVRGAMVDWGTWPAGKAAITEPTQEVIDAIAAMMAADPTLTVVIETHSHRNKKGEESTELSHRRAQAAEVALVRAGVNPDRISSEAGDGVGALLRFRLAAADEES